MPPGVGESMLGYHSCNMKVLTCGPESGRGTLLGGQFDWGGRLLKSSGGAQRLAPRTLARSLPSLPPILYMEYRDPISSYSEAPWGLSV